MELITFLNICNKDSLDSFKADQKKTMKENEGKFIDLLCCDMYITESVITLLF